VFRRISVVHIIGAIFYCSAASRTGRRELPATLLGRSLRSLVEVLESKRTAIQVQHRPSLLFLRTRQNSVYFNLSTYLNWKLTATYICSSWSGVIHTIRQCPSSVWLGPLRHGILDLTRAVRNFSRKVAALCRTTFGLKLPAADAIAYVDIPINTLVCAYWKILELTIQIEDACPVTLLTWWAISLNKGCHESDESKLGNAELHCFDVWIGCEEV
jgi:hypothetical protein